MRLFVSLLKRMESDGSRAGKAADRSVGLNVMLSSIIDNREENTLLLGIQRIGATGRELLIATAFFSLDALLLLADTLARDRIYMLTLPEIIRDLYGRYTSECRSRRVLRNSLPGDIGHLVVGFCRSSPPDAAQRRR